MPALKPEAWWLFFRRDLGQYRIGKMSDDEWRLALDLAATRDLRPWEAAKAVSNLRFIQHYEGVRRRPTQPAP